MLLHQFNRLAENSQHRHLLQHGVCVADRFTDSEDRLLFQLQDYYVEVVFMRYTDQIIRLNCFRGTTALQPYLEEIAIDHLLNTRSY